VINLDHLHAAAFRRQMFLQFLAMPESATAAAMPQCHLYPPQQLVFNLSVHTFPSRPHVAKISVLAAVKPASEKKPKIGISGVILSVRSPAFHVPPQLLCKLWRQSEHPSLAVLR
jgi:hypothetical protein